MVSRIFCQLQAIHADAVLHGPKAVLEMSGTLSDLCWPDVTGRMCCRLMRDLRYLDLSYNCALAAAPAQGEVGRFMSGDRSPEAYLNYLTFGIECAESNCAPSLQRRPKLVKWNSHMLMSFCHHFMLCR